MTAVSPRLGGTRRWYNSPSGLIGAAAFLAIVAILAVVIAVSGGSDSVGAPTPPGAPVVTPADTDQSIPFAAPVGVSWNWWQGVSLPSSSRYGPQVNTGGLAVGFSHSPRGALLATIQACGRLWSNPNDDWQPEMDRAIAPGVGRDSDVQLRNSSRFTAPPEGWAQFVAFRFIDYSGDRATISLATTAQTAAYQTAAHTVVWNGSDWQLVLAPDGGDSEAPPVETNDLMGYVPFGGAA